MSNKEIVNKSQSILKELGYEVKTGHLYELFSQLQGYKSWNVASAKDTDFSNLLMDPETKALDEYYKELNPIIEVLKGGFEGVFIFNKPVNDIVFLEEIAAGIIKAQWQGISFQKLRDMLDVATPEMVEKTSSFWSEFDRPDYRWLQDYNYDLAKDALDILIEVEKKHPDLKIPHEQ